ncbi:MAG: hypothetical protein KF716_01190 [Anaerolineae bacterium]|nr:hypothetical protein [Anaerolineae bacterium]
MTEVISWLLDSSVPSIRYLTLRRLLGYDEADKEVTAARSAMQMSGPIPAILDKQTLSGQWEGSTHYYSPKYVSTHWSMVLLLELAADPNDERVQRGVEHMLEATEQNHMLKDEYDRSVPSPAQFGFVCFWGNVLRYAAEFNYATDSRLTPIIEYTVRNLDAGGCQCIHNDYLPCAWGAVRSLWGLAAIPNRSETVEGVIKKTLDFLVGSGNQLVGGHYPSRGTPHKMWNDLNFPLFYQVDVLFTLRVLADLKALHLPGAQPALEWLVAKREPSGHWHGSSPFKARTWKRLGNAEEIDRWVTLQAMHVLQQAGIDS